MIQNIAVDAEALAHKMDIYEQGDDAQIARAKLEAHLKLLGQKLEAPARAWEQSPEAQALAAQGHKFWTETLDTPANRDMD